MRVIFRKTEKGFEGRDGRKALYLDRKSTPPIEGVEYVCSITADKGRYAFVKVVEPVKMTETFHSEGGIRESSEDPRFRGEYTATEGRIVHRFLSSSPNDDGEVWAREEWEVKYVLSRGKGPKELTSRVRKKYPLPEDEVVELISNSTLEDIRNHIPVLVGSKYAHLVIEKGKEAIKEILPSLRGLAEELERLESEIAPLRARRLALREKLDRVRDYEEHAGWISLPVKGIGNATVSYDPETGEIRSISTVECVYDPFGGFPSLVEEDGCCVAGGLYGSSRVALETRDVPLEELSEKALSAIREAIAGEIEKYSSPALREDLEQSFELRRLYDEVTRKLDYLKQQSENIIKSHEELLEKLTLALLACGVPLDQIFGDSPVKLIREAERKASP